MDVAGYLGIASGAAKKSVMQLILMDMHLLRVRLLQLALAVVH